MLLTKFKLLYCYGCWHSIYQRFKRGSEKGIWWKSLMILQQSKKLLINIVITDSTTFKLHQHGGGLKEGCKANEKVKENEYKITSCYDYSMAHNRTIFN